MKGYPVYFLLSALIVVISNNAKAQSASLKGKVFDENNLAAQAVTIALLRSTDSLLVKIAASDSSGAYQFKEIRPGSYLILISRLGYHKVFRGPFSISANNTIIVSDVKIKVQDNTLGEILVRDRKSYIDVRPDKTILNVDRNILAAGTSVLSVLSNAPGVKINGAGDVLLRAGQKALILINGKQIKLEGADLAAFLQNFQSADVDQIELIPNPSAKYDAGGAGGVINIILKKGANQGFNGSTTTTVGYGKFIKAGKSATGNYRTKNINIFGSTGYSYNKTYHTIIYDRTVNDAQRSSFNTHYYNTQKTPKFDYRLGTDVFLDSLHTIGFLVYGSTSINRFNKQTNTSLALNGVPDSMLTTTSNLKRHLNNSAWNLNYSGKLARHQTLSADIDVAVNYRRAYEYLISMPSANTSTVYLPLKPKNDTLQNTAPTRITNEAIKTDYVNILSNANRLEAGLQGSYVNNDNFQYFNHLQNGVYTPFGGLTSHFLYKEKTGAAYINFNHTGKIFSYNTGLRYEAIRTDADLISANDGIKRNYNNFYPSVQGIYDQPKWQLILDYNRRIVKLDYNTLNPIISYQDSYNYRQGNPYLRPAYDNTLQLTYYRKSGLRAHIYAQHTSDFNSFVFFTQNDATKVLISTRTNLRYYNSVGFNLNLPVMLTNWWNVDLDADVSYQHYRDYNNLLNKGTKDIQLKLDQTFNLSKSVTAKLYGQYESPTLYGLASLRPAYYATAGISKQFGRLSNLTLSVADIFNTDRDRYRINFANLNIQSFDKTEKQIARLTFVHRFGKNTVKAQRKHNPGNEEEIRRMNSNTL